MIALPQAVPALAELCCRELACHESWATKCSKLPPAVRARVLHHARASSHFDEEVLQHFDAEEVVLSNSRVTDRGLDIVSRVCGQRLLVLGLSRCVRLHDSGVSALVRRCPLLKQLDVSYCRLTDAAIQCVARCCSGLSDINYSWNGSGIGDAAARALAASSPALQALPRSMRTPCVRRPYVTCVVAGGGAVWLARLGRRAALARVRVLQIVAAAGPPTHTRVRAACALPSAEGHRRVVRLLRLNLARAGPQVTGCHLLTEAGVVAAFTRLSLLRTLALSQVRPPFP
jgi:hypothetical protein